MENKDQSVGKVIKTLVDVLQLFKREMRKRAKLNAQEDYADRYDQIMDTLTLPLYFAWEKYGIGKLDEIMDDWELYLPYQNFKSNIKENLVGLIEGLQEMDENNNIFADMEKDGKVTQGLLTLYKNLLQGINAGVFR